MNQYFEQMVLSASPVELIRLLYQKGIASTRSAREHLKNRRIAERGQAINNVILILDELVGSLRPEEAPELSRRLKGLYLYMQRRLVEANLKQQDQPLAEVLGLLTVLAEPWNNTSLNWNGSAYKPWASADLSAEERGRIAVSA